MSKRGKDGWLQHGLEQINRTTTDQQGRALAHVTQNVKGGCQGNRGTLPVFWN